MSDVFISYAREDRAIAERLAGALAAEQWRVWWDLELGAGDSFRETIEAELDTARVVIVLWSPHSVESSFVRDEAARAQSRGVLVPLAVGGLDLADLPLGFGELHTETLSGWSGEVDDPRFARVLAGLRRRLSGKPSQAFDDQAAPAGVTSLAPATHAPPPPTPDAEWTWSRTLLLVVLCIDITIVVIWLLIYARHYADVAMIVGGVWAAIMGTIGRLRIRTKETSLCAFLGLPPVQATIATYSVLIVGAVPLFALAELPIHRVTVVPSVADGTPSLSMTVLRGVDTTHARTGPPDWRFYARRGRYVLRALPEGHEEWSHSFQVGWFGLSQQIELPEFRVAAVDPPAAVDSPTDVSEAEEQTDPEPGPVGDDVGNRTTNGERPRFGTLNVRSTPAGVDVWVSGEHVGVTPLQLERAPGTYTIELKSRHVDDARFGYHATGTVRVRAGDESGFETDLDPVELPTLLVRRGPDATVGVYYLDSVTSDGLLGQISGAARTFVVFPGDRLVLKKVGDTVTECSRVTLSAGQQEQIVC